MIQRIYHILRAVKELFRFNVISPRACFGKNVSIGHFTIIEHDVDIGDNSWIGSCTHIRPGTKIGHNSEVRDQCFVAGYGVVIGNYTKICQQANIVAGMQIGDRCFISPGISAANTKQIKHQRNIEAYRTDAPIIEEGVRAGTNVTLLPGVRLSKDSYIGGGAVVAKDVDSWGIYVGNPARKIGEVPQKDRLGGQHHRLTENKKGEV